MMTLLSVKNNKPVFIQEKHRVKLNPQLINKIQEKYNTLGPENKTALFSLTTNHSVELYTDATPEGIQLVKPTAQLKIDPTPEILDNRDNATIDIDLASGEITAIHGYIPINKNQYKWIEFAQEESKAATLTTETCAATKCKPSTTNNINTDQLLSSANRTLLQPFIK